MERVLETGIYCHRCNCLIKNEELVEWECGKCHTEPWQHVEIVMKGKGMWNEK